MTRRQKWAYRVVSLGTINASFFIVGLSWRGYIALFVMAAGVPLWHFSFEQPRVRRLYISPDQSIIFSSEYELPGLIDEGWTVET